MRMVMGLDRPTDGIAVIAGRAYRDLTNPLREVGALLDAAAVHPGRRAHDHLLALARSNGIARGRVSAVLDQVGLSSVAGRRVGTFSLGMRQRLGIAAALLGDPPVLLFDEQINGLDPEGIAWIRQLMRTLAAEGRTVFLSSHLMSEMEDTADRLVVIGSGRPSPRQASPSSSSPAPAPRCGSSRRGSPSLSACSARPGRRSPPPTTRRSW